MERKELILKRLELLFIILIFVLLFIIIVNTPIINKYRNYGELIINEVMAGNTSTIRDEYGNYSDYIEIYNGYDYDINMSGYYLSDDNFDTKKWSFPSGTIIKGKSYLIVYATDNNYEYEELHTNFKINKKGEVITLSDNDANVLSRVYFNETIDNTSYGYNGNKYVYYYNGSPGYNNNGEYSLEAISKSYNNTLLYVNEYMTNNVSYYKNKSNSYDSMIEIYNDNSYSVNLSGYHLSNDTNKLNKYTFPDVLIEAKSYLTVFMSSKNGIINGEVHANFKLDEGVLILSDNKNSIISKIVINDLPSNVSYGLYEGNWHYYNNPSFGNANGHDYLNEIDTKSDIIISEVSSINPEAIEIKNISNYDVNLSNYSIGDKSGYVRKLPNIKLKKGAYLVIYGSDKYSYKNNKLSIGFHINNSTEIIYLYKDNVVVSKFMVGNLKSNISTGIDSNMEKVYYDIKTIGKSNSKTSFLGYAEVPKYSINGGYVESGTVVELSTSDGSQIYYTIDGSFPNKKSKLYNGPIVINKTTVIKAISYKEGYISSEIASRTFFVGRHHNLPVVSITASKDAINKMFNNYTSDKETKISFEFYEDDGSFGVGFTGGTKFTGADSRKRKQKSMAIYLRKEYGLNEVTYPFFKDSDVLSYSSFTLRNSGEDPYGVRIEDTALTYALNGQMDIDMQDYRAVVVYINGSYYGLYNMREKLNGDYIKSNYGIDSGYDLIKYASATKGSTANYDKIVNYINSHNVKKKDVYEYIKSQIDVQELCNYLIVESYYANTDQGNIRYWKSKNGKWRWMLYDLDWSLYSTSYSFNYMVLNANSPSVTSLYSLYNIGRKLYQNSEFKDMYLSTLAYHLKNTWNPKRMNMIIDSLANEIRDEIPYHIKRWNDKPNSVKAWNNNISSFKKKLTSRYNYVVKNVRSQFNLTKKEYKKYFGDL